MDTRISIMGVLRNTKKKLALCVLVLFVGRRATGTG